LCASQEMPQCRSTCGTTSLASTSELFLCRACRQR
jgi:hypothetical protein